MRSTVIEVCLVTFCSLAGSLVITLAACYVLALPRIDLSLMIASICPLVLAPPISFQILKKKEQLGVAMTALARAHEELAEAYQKLDHKAQHDGLTGLMNRSTFFTEAQKQSALHRDSSLLVIDADHFKYVNDTQGHAVGDLALVHIATIMRKVVGDKGLVGRIGGEEFAVLLPGIAAARATDVAEEISSTIASDKLTTQDGALIHLSVSIGAARCASDGSIEHAFIEADRNLYVAKAGGRNRVHAPDLMPTDYGELQIEPPLSLAFAANAGS